MKPTNYARGVLYGSSMIADVEDFGPDKKVTLRSGEELFMLFDREVELPEITTDPPEISLGAQLAELIASEIELDIPEKPETKLDRADRAGPAFRCVVRSVNGEVTHRYLPKMRSWKLNRDHQHRD